MKLVNIISAEWNPDNQILLKIADADTQNSNNSGIYPSIGDTRRTVVLDGISEAEATFQTVVARLAAMSIEPTRTEFNIY